MARLLQIQVKLEHDLCKHNVMVYVEVKLMLQLFCLQEQGVFVDAHGEAILHQLFLLLLANRQAFPGKLIVHEY